MTTREMKNQEFRECPLREIGTLANFCNFYPLCRGAKTVEGEVVPHPKDWVKVTTIKQWKQLSIGAVLFVKYDGADEDGWKKGYYLVNKR